MLPLNTVIAWYKTYYEHSRYDNNTFYYFPLGHISFTCPVILGRPFLRTVGAIIDLRDGIIKY